MINLSPQHFEIIQRILSPFSIQFYVFGSRTKDSNREFSDLDICYKDPIDWKSLVQIKTQLEESNLPFKVDIVDYNSCSQDFRSIIDVDLIEFNQSNLKPFA